MEATRASGTPWFIHPQSGADAGGQWDELSAGMNGWFDRSCRPLSTFARCAGRYCRRDKPPHDNISILNII